MIVLYILLGIILFFALLFSFHIKFYLKLDGETTIHAGFGPIVLKLAPKKPPKPVDLSDFTYEKHQKRLAKEKKAAQKKAAKEEKKRQDKALSERAEKTVQTIDEAKDEHKLASVIDILTLVFNEIPKLASYVKTEIRMLDITVGGKDADKIGRTYGKIAALVPMLIDLLENKTDFRKLKPDTIHVNADFLAEKTTYRMHIRIKLRLFSILRIGFHALKWFIGLKIREAKMVPKKRA